MRSLEMSQKTVDFCRRGNSVVGLASQKWQKSVMHPCVRCVAINCGSDAKHRGPATPRFQAAFQTGAGACPEWGGERTLRRKDKVARRMHA
jgi:hypothetical protein